MASLVTRTTRTPTGATKADAPDVYPKGRRCSAEGCNHLLSIYNAGPNCHACGHSDLDLEEALERILAEAPGR